VTFHTLNSDLSQYRERNTDLHKNSISWRVIEYELKESKRID
jgi:hypothetical protein